MKYDLCRPSVIRQLMGDQGTGLKKAYGQNFLINSAIPEEIADRCAADPETEILEIGPGIGCLTACLAERYRHVTAVEIDRTLIPILAQTLEDYENVDIINEDVMKVDLSAWAEEVGDRPIAVCANLPYYITTPILMRLLECGVHFRSITVMVQAEVADRLAAAPGSDSYGAISAVIGYYGSITKLISVSAGNFLPAPKVNSAVVRIDLYETPRYAPKDRKLFFGLIHAAFEQRRKTLVNAINAKYPHLSKEAVANALQACGFSEKIRGERLSTADFARLADALS